MIQIDSIKFTMNDLRNAYHKNFYDIYYQQKHYFDRESRVRKYEKYSNDYIYLRDLIPKQERVPSFSYEKHSNLEKKYYHFFYTSFSKYMVSLSYSNILEKYFSVELENSDEFVLIVPETFSSLDAKLIHYLFSLHIPNFNKKEYIVFTNKTFLVEKNVFDFDFIESLLEKIKHVKQHFLRFHIIKEKDPLYFPQFFHSGVMNDQQKIADGIAVGEISILYQCGKQIRQKCHEKKIFSFHDSEFLNQLSPRLKPIISRILQVNQQESPWKIIDTSIKNEKDYLVVQEKYKKNKILYIDLEFTKDRMYLCGFYDNDDNFEYIWETHSTSDFMNELLTFLRNHQDYIFLYYCAEKKKIKEYIKKLNIHLDESFFDNFIDLYTLLSKYCAFKGSYDFRLKSITKAFQKKGILQNGYEDEECQSGLESIEMFDNFLIFKKKQIKESIINYNKLDCYHQKIILEEIL